MPQQLTFQVSVSVNDPMVYVGPPTLPDAVVGENYSFQLQVNGGVPPLFFEGSGFPSGLMLTNAGLVEGIPQSAGGSMATVMVTDASGSVMSGRMAMGATNRASDAQKRQILRPNR